MIVALMLALSLPAGLESKAKSAYTYIEKAKSALSVGHAKSGNSYLAKAQGLLGGVLDKVPGGSLLKKLDSSNAKQGDSGALSQAEQQAAKLDPSLAGKLGLAKQQAQQGDNNAAADTAQETKQEAAQKTGLSSLQDAYDKVSQARKLVNLGDLSKAKGLLDAIPGL